VAEGWVLVTITGALSACVVAVVLVLVLVVMCVAVYVRYHRFMVLACYYGKGTKYYDIS
jgi:hypothetical protein